MRVKVMQTIYNWYQDPQLSRPEVVNRYKESVKQSYDLLLFNLRNVVLIARMSVEDKEKRNQKYLPTEDDRQFEPILYRNVVISSIEENKIFKNTKGKHYNDYLDVAQARKLYRNFCNTESYANYLKINEPSEEQHIEILLELWKYLIQDQLYLELVYDGFPIWIDDDTLVKGFIKRIVKGISTNQMIIEEFKPDEDTIKIYGETLLNDVIDHFAEYEKRLVPYLKNWDVDRIAIIDQILIKMALSEFIAFASIPTKVTLNEYVEIAKMYSTDKSKDFINGILDAVLKDLLDGEEIKKQGRGLLQ
ncbi:transcription antitermination factor NusB [Membranihabitans marinus]